LPAGTSYDPYMKPCQCCGQYTLPDDSLYELCDVCGWQNEPTLEHAGVLMLDVGSGANGTTLRVARAAWQEERRAMTCLL
jgi:hypothetical protein